MDGWMSKQIDKQMNNKRLVLKKGQIAILEALYGGVGLGDVGVLGWVRVPPEYTLSPLKQIVNTPAFCRIVI